MATNTLFINTGTNKEDQHDKWQLNKQMKKHFLLLSIIFLKSNRQNINHPLPSLPALSLNPCIFLIQLDKFKKKNNVKETNNYYS